MKENIDLRRVHRAGVVAGLLSFIAFLGVVKDLNAILDSAGRGEVAWGSLMVRSTSLQREWFGYKLTGISAWYASFLHVSLYAATMIGLHRHEALGVVAGVIILAVYPRVGMDVWCCTRLGI